MGMSSAAWLPLERHLGGFDRIRIGLPGAGGMLARQPLLTMLNFASLAGVTGLRPYGPYNMAKEAVRALTRTAAR